MIFTLFVKTIDIIVKDINPIKVFRLLLFINKMTDKIKYKMKLINAKC